jgi:hypothetical protein
MQTLWSFICLSRGGLFSNRCFLSSLLLRFFACLIGLTCSHNVIELLLPGSVFGFAACSRTLP